MSNGYSLLIGLDYYFFGSGLVVFAVGLVGGYVHPGFHEGTTLVGEYVTG